jgi:hypothetical protein
MVEVIMPPTIGAAIGFMRSDPYLKGNSIAVYRGRSKVCLTLECIPGLILVL